MKKLLLILMLSLASNVFAQTVLTDKTFEKAINGRSAFSDDGSSIVVVEFWASFNDANSFKGWENIKGVKYYRCDISLSPEAKKNHKVRTIPHIVIFKDGYDEEHIKAGLDFAIDMTPSQLQEKINQLINESKF